MESRILSSRVPPPNVLTAKKLLTGYTKSTIVSQAAAISGEPRSRPWDPNHGRQSDERERTAGGPTDAGAEWQRLVRTVVAGGARGHDARGGPLSTPPPNGPH